MSDCLWGVYDRGEGEEVTLQATPQHRGRYERKGFVFKRYLPGYGYGAAVGVSDPANRAATAIFGEKVGDLPDVEDSAVVKEAMEVALRKITGTWTDAEQIASYEQHKEGHLLPDESANMLSGDDPTKGYEEIAPKLVSGELKTPAQGAAAALGPAYTGAPPTQAVSPDGGKPVSTAGADGAGRDGAGTPAARPPR